MLICFIFPRIEEAQAAARRAPAGLFYAPGLAGDMPRCLSVMRQTGRDATKLTIPRQLPLSPIVVFAIGIKYAWAFGRWNRIVKRSFPATGIFATNRSYS